MEGEKCRVGRRGEEGFAVSRGAVGEGLTEQGTLEI
jgi:hypothetical protein